ncbi:MAG: histidinol-phosphatase HisJ family protein [Desulfobulbaceae bacterium]|nr:histidinol-phosphatase HisJ family protein [Desulfobulbaceae bacterium]
MKNLPDIKADNHVHTRLCNHAHGEMEEYVLAAIKAGLRTLTFLEHLEVGINYDHRTWLTDDDFDLYFKEGRRLKKWYADRITIRLGVETGYNPNAVADLRERLANYPWDLIGLSYHFYHNGFRHLNMVSRRQDNLDALAVIGVDRIISDYFSSLLQAIDMLDCDVLCHLDAVMRHYPGVRFNEIHLQQIDQLLKAMKKKGMALEINTSGFAIRGEPYPRASIIGKAVGLGIPLIAGSDAHQPEHVGRYFDRLPEWIERITKLK